MQAKKLELCVLCHLKSPIPPLLRATQTTFPFLIIFLSTLSNVLCGGFQLSQLISISPCASLLGLLRRDLAEPLPFPSHSPPPPLPLFISHYCYYFKTKFTSSIYWWECLRTGLASAEGLGGGQFLMCLPSSPTVCAFPSTTNPSLRSAPSPSTDHPQGKIHS